MTIFCPLTRPGNTRRTANIRLLLFSLLPYHFYRVRLDERAMKKSQLKTESIPAQTLGQPYREKLPLKIFHLLLLSLSVFGALCNRCSNIWHGSTFSCTLCDARSPVKHPSVVLVTSWKEHSKRLTEEVGVRRFAPVWYVRVCHARKFTSIWSLESPDQSSSCASDALTCNGTRIWFLPIGSHGKPQFLPSACFSRYRFCSTIMFLASSKPTSD